MKLREALFLDKSYQALFISQLKKSNKELPDKSEEIWKVENGVNKTPFYDQIELMDFYLNDFDLLP